VPFVGESILSQNKGKPPVIITLLAAARERNGDSFAAAKKDRRAWRTLIRAIALNVRQMPLRYLQNVGGDTPAFLYDPPGDAAAPATIRLHPGVVFHQPRKSKCLDGQQFQPEYRSRN
jgi:hypothetical protein